MDESAASSLVRGDGGYDGGGGEVLQLWHSFVALCPIFRNEVSFQYFDGSTVLAVQS
jgi:lysophospholipid acyltransferase (LPLAT)-like uncharacterized protein